MQIIKSIPRGYCHGVVKALNITAKTIKEEPKPIYILGEIVHNKKISDAFLEAGAITLKGNTRKELLKEIDKGTVIITAHGINPKLIEEAENKGLNVVDATCSDVYKTHNIIKKYLKENYEVIYIGKKSHPEPEGVLGISDKIHLISNIEDIKSLNINNDKIIVTNQTTMSKYEIGFLHKELLNKFPSIKIIEEICDATSLRQDIALKNSKKADLSYVVGDENSNNTNKLVEICQNLGNCKTFRIESIEDLNIEDLKKAKVVHITSGASTPTVITSEVIKFIENFDPNDPNTHNNISKIKSNRIIPRIEK